MKTRVIGQEVRESEESPDQAYFSSKSKRQLTWKTQTGRMVCEVGRKRQAAIHKHK